MQILETKEVKKYYQTPSGIVRALDGVSLSVKEGTFGAIVGSSGSGKTTLLHMLGGLDEPTDGQVWVRGTALKGMSGEEKTVFRRRIFYGLIVTILVLTVGSGVLGGVAVVMKSRIAYFRFAYPWRELLGVLVILSGLCVAIPEGVFRRMQKTRGIERTF